MRNILTIVILCAVVMLNLKANAQESKITKKDLPAAVLNAFKNAYPAASIKGLSTEKEKGKTYFEIESVDGKAKRDLLYEADGTLVEIEEVIGVHELPDAVREAIKKEYPRGTITLAEQTTKGKAITYELRVVSGKSKATVTVSPEGKVLEKED